MQENSSLFNRGKKRCQEPLSLGEETVPDTFLSPGTTTAYLTSSTVVKAMQPDGKRIAFTTVERSSELWVMEKFLP